MTKVQQLRDRFRGCLIGLACGDAVGAAAESRDRATLVAEPVTDMVGGGVFNLKPGEWTDDTAMAFALGASLVTAGTFDPNDIMHRWAEWMHGRAYGPSNGRGCFDIGGTTRKALSDYLRTGDPFQGEACDWSAANGCIMRLAPLAMFSIWLPAAERHALAADCSRLTHGHPLCIAATVLLNRILVRLLRGGPLGPFTLLEGLPADARQEKTDAIFNRGRYLDGNPPASSGYVVDTLAAALWAFTGAEDFKDAVLRAANLGGDADTVAAVTGQIAGAAFGYEAIPAEWRAKLDRHAELLAIADALALRAAKDPAARLPAAVPVAVAEAADWPVADAPELAGFPTPSHDLGNPVG